jgi:CDP-paratose 2-epimerase
MKTGLEDELELKIGINRSSYPEIGFTEWFHKDDFTHVENTIKDLHVLGIKNLRTGVFMEEFNSEGGEQWYDWLFAKLSENLTVLPCFFIEPFHFDANQINGFPDNIDKELEVFIETVINRYNPHFDYIEFRYGPYNNAFHDLPYFHLPDIFEQIILETSFKAHKLGKKTLLGGIKPSDALWLREKSNILKSIDAIGISGFPGTFDVNWKGWKIEIGKIEDVLEEQNIPAELWITDTGYSCWRNDDPNQVTRFLSSLNNSVKRIYWFSLYDLPEKNEDIHFDERDYHFGIKNLNGGQKLLFRILSQYKLPQIEKEIARNSSSKLKINNSRKGILITGGAGFIGTNLANRLLQEGKRVIIYDNLSRPGVENNLKWLLTKYPDLEVMIADINDIHSLTKAVKEVRHVFHFAAQVAVTSSLQSPRHDYKVNSGGTFNLLETIRTSTHKPSLIYTSTNKVYGDLSGLKLNSDKKRYYPVEADFFQNGINETCPLNFLSPYGNSKGCADQYVLDFARSYGLRNVVFRMSCIYGPHQFGTEDQGWIAHFLNQSIKNNKITIYGDGKQVRDILFIDDLIEAFILAMNNIHELRGEAFNIGGGPGNSISLIELISLMHKLDHLKIHVIYDSWRTGDQKYYVSDTRKFRNMTGWVPKVTCKEGVANIFNWLYEHIHTQNTTTLTIK